jgi:hypothetical protein
MCIASGLASTSGVTEPVARRGKKICGYGSMRQPSTSSHFCRSQHRLYRHDVRSYRRISESAPLTVGFRRVSSLRPVRQGCSSRGIAWAERDAAPAGGICTPAPGRLRDPPSATRSGRELFAWRRRASAWGQRGPGDRNRRGGAPRGERPALRDARRFAKARSRASSRRKTPAGVRHSPAKGAALAPERLSALRSLAVSEGH